MSIRRFAFPALLAVMLMAFAVPSHANVIHTASGTVSCTGYSLTLTFTGLNRAPTTYTASLAFTFTPTVGQAVTSTFSTASFSGDALGNATVVTTGTFPPPTLAGTYTVTGTASLVGGTGPSSVSISFTSAMPIVCTTPGADGRFTGGGKQIDVAGVTITKGLELDCDFQADMAGSDNLEINWYGNQFHMKTFLFASCELEGIRPNPPTAPINEMNGVGTGRYDGTDGYIVLFTLEDHGEPGRNDMACFRIYSPGNAPAGILTGSPTCETAPAGDILNFPLTPLTHGNLQAHVDQH